MAEWYWRKRFFKFCWYIFAISLLSPLGKGQDLNLKELKCPLLRMLCAMFSWNWTSGSEESDENVKSLRQRRTMDKLLSEKNSKLFVEFDLVIHANERDVIWYFDQNKFIIYPTNVLSEKIKCTCTYILRKKNFERNTGNFFLCALKTLREFPSWKSS